MQNTDTGGIRREHIRPLEREISGTTYIVTGQFSATARETAVEKMQIDEALECKRTGEKKRILFGLTGTGYFDLSAYKQYNDGAMTDYIPTEADLKRGFDSIPKCKVNEGLA